MLLFNGHDDQDDTPIIDEDDGEPGPPFDMDDPGW